MSSQSAPTCSFTSDSRLWGQLPSGLWVPAQIDADGNLKVNIAVVADGADSALGTTTDAAVPVDNNGTLIGHVRYLAQVLASVWDSINARLNVAVQNATLAVTQSGSWVLSAGSAIIGNVRIDQTTPGTTNGVQVVAALPAGTNQIGAVTPGYPASIVTLEVAYTAAQTDAAIVTVGSTDLIVVTQIQALTDEATTVGVGFRVGFGATTTPTTTGVVLTHPGLVPGSGVSRGDGGGVLGAGVDGEDLRITSEVPTGGSLRVLVTYYIV